MKLLSRTKPKINKKLMASLWFDADRGFIFSNGDEYETVAGFQCTFSYNVFYGEIGYIVNSMQEHFKPENENEIIVFLKYNIGTITGEYVSDRPKFLSDGAKRLFHKIEDRFNESIRDLNCGYSIEF